jgi:hypothetical protein
VCLFLFSTRADHKAAGTGDPAPVTNGGTAMLVMRHFGYLGLHVSEAIASIVPVFSFVLMLPSCIGGC